MFKHLFRGNNLIGINLSICSHHKQYPLIFLFSLLHVEVFFHALSFPQFICALGNDIYVLSSSENISSTTANQDSNCRNLGCVLTGDMKEST